MSSIVEGRATAGTRPHSLLEDMNSLGSGMISLKERLASLNKSAESWQTRVKKDELILKRCSVPPRPRPTCALLGKENVERVIGEKSAAPMPRHVPISKQSLLLNLDKGLDSFFPAAQLRY